MLATMKMENNKVRIHPQRYLMWIAIASIVMMFAGLSSAFIVKRAQANWVSYTIPLAFYYSTATIVISSVAIIMARKSFINRQMHNYSLWLAFTIFLGFLFVMLQYYGFVHLWNQGVTLSRNVSFSFLYVIVGLHALHVTGGLVALIVMFIQSLNKNKRVYSAIHISIMGTYWHFVDILWLYLLLFLIIKG